MKYKTDSRKIKRGDTFIAIKGVSHDGHDFIEDAIANGASHIIAERGTYSVSYEIVSDTRVYLQNYLEKYYYPKIKDMKLIGVTGTNGKTTTSYLLYQALRMANKKCAYIGTIGFYLDQKEMELSNTTPDLLDLYTLLFTCMENGFEYVVMEVSSHALSFGRVEGLLFDYVIYTNLTQDHLDYHGTMENYALAKEKLFYKLKKDGKAIINNDDFYKNRFLKPDNLNLTYGILDGSDYQIKDLKSNASGSIFTLFCNGEDTLYKTQLLGKYNIYNLTAVLVVLIEEDIHFTLQNIENLVAPIGRMEKIRYNDNAILIDYAHTPDAVEKVLKCVSTFTCGKIYTIIGCGGDRDRTKRPIMAKVATTYSHYAIFTSDNPRSENPYAIFEDMKEGLSLKNYEWIEDREKAIYKGMQLLEKNDILLILGKGHEHYQLINGEKKHFDDKEIVMKYI